MTRDAKYAFGLNDVAQHVGRGWRRNFDSAAAIYLAGAARMLTKEPKVIQLAGPDKRRRGAYK